MNWKLSALVFFFCMVSLPTDAATWILIGKTNRGDVFFVDKSSLQKDGDSVTFWYRTNYVERSPAGALSHKIQKTVNCHRREQIGRYVMGYDDIDNRGRLTTSGDPNDRWAPIPPESMHWEMMLFVCRK